MTAFQFRMPVAFAGIITGRAENATIEPGVLNPASPFPGWGLPGKIVGGMFVPIAGGDTAAAIYGILVRPFPYQGTVSADPLGNPTPPTSGMCSIMKRGYVGVQLGGTTNPVKFGPVWVRISNPSAGKVVGDLEGASDTTNTIQMAASYFMGPWDASQSTELAVNI